MENILVRIKRAVLAGNYAFSEKARLEIEADVETMVNITICPICGGNTKK